MKRFNERAPLMERHYDAADLSGVQAYFRERGEELRADEGIFLASELAYVKARNYERKLPEMRGLTLVPIATDIPEDAEYIKVQTYDAVGVAKIISNYADDLPRVDVWKSETMRKVHDLGDAYGYNLAELRASARAGTSLPDRKAAAARRAVDIKLNQMAMIGDPQYGVYGLLNHPNIGTTAITGGWLTATPDVIAADWLKIVGAVFAQSNGVHTTTNVLMPPAQLERASALVYGAASNETLLSFIQRVRPGITFSGIPELAGAGAGGKDVVIAYEKSGENMEFQLVSAFRQLPPQAKNLELRVPCLARSGGVEVYYPLSITKGLI